MTLRVSPTLALCLAGAIAAGIGLARPALTSDAPTPAVAGVEADAADVGQAAVTADSPYFPDESVDAGAVDPAAPASLSIEGFAFLETVEVAAGESITITNFDGVGHTVTANDGAFDTGLIDGNGTTTLAAPSASGSYSYFCSIHPSMTGVVVVN